MEIPINNGTEEFKGLESISSNPHREEILDFAIEDLNNAIDIGPCNAHVPINSTIIPICETSNRHPKKSNNNQHK